MLYNFGSPRNYGLVYGMLLNTVFAINQFTMINFTKRANTNYPWKIYST